MAGRRFVIFLTVALSIWGAVHLYVFWRLGSATMVRDHVSPAALAGIGVALWLSYFIARTVNGLGYRRLANPLEHLASTWVGFAFLLFSGFLALDFITLGGFLLPQAAPHLRTGVAMIALMLGIIGLIQGRRAPGVTPYEFQLSNLPTELDGTTLAVVSDFHLGRLLGEDWLRQRIQQIDELKPDCVLAVGDILDGAKQELEPLVPALRSLRARWGVWAVTGNHEFYEGLDHSLEILQQAGWQVLRDDSFEVAPGLVVAGVDDLTARGAFAEEADPLDNALKDRPAGATILMSHSPMQAEKAAELGVDLMFCGHTHGGQLWPFNHFVRMRYAMVAGLFQVGELKVVVGRGTGTWGPRMRLWKRSEILKVVLRTASGRTMN